LVALYILLFLFWISQFSEAISEPYTPSKREFTKLERLEPIPELKPVNIPPKPKTLARVAKNDQIAIKEQVRSIASQHGWGDGEQWEALQWIIQKESSWNINAQNKRSTAYSLFQFLDQTWKSYGCIKNNDVENVTQCGIKYIKKRYGTPVEAKVHHIRKGWY
jgi:hypothetical protein